jgi:PKD repeat protein
MKHREASRQEMIFKKKRRMKDPIFLFNLLVVILFLCSNKMTFAQHEYDVWYFGVNAGLDFKSGTPIVLTNGVINTSEGTSSIADSSGNLLFYTDGITVKNKNHQQMQNGFGLNGGYSSSQSALIIRQPGADAVYYIFTTGDFTSEGLSYSVVDMTLQNGLGQVILKNISLLNTGTEKLTAVRHSNGTDYWILAHEWNNNHFNAYQFTSAGVNSIPIVSSTGSSHSGPTNNSIGYMRSSHDGTRLALCVLDDNYFELFDFDKSTAVVSNPIHLDGIFPNDGAYGIEFSPNDSILYGSEYQPGLVLQWDITSGDDSIINASRYVVATTSSDYGGAIALASDGKIYMAEQNTNWLGAVQNPNVYGSGCIYLDHAINLSPKYSLAGLPNIPGDWFKTEINDPLPLAGFAASTTFICEKFCIDFIDSSLNDPAGWEWLFPGGNPSASSDQNPLNICYNSPGNYDVTLIITNSIGTDTLTLNDYLTVNPTPNIPSITQNGNILTSTAAPSYQWQFNNADIPGATNQSYEVTETGYYTVIIIDQNGCSSSETQYVLATVVEQVFVKESVLVYPNPSGGSFIVEWLNCLIADKISIAVFNTLGQIVFSSEEKIYPGHHFIKTIDVTSLPPDVYFLELFIRESSGSIINRSEKKKVIILK